MSSLRTALIIFSALVAGSALAADLDSCQISQDQRDDLGCLCVVRSDAPAALLESIKGSVLRSGDASFTPITEHSDLFVGDRVIFKSDGEGILVAENCRNALGPNQSVEIKPIDDNCACAALLQKPKAAGWHHKGLLLGAAAIVGAKVVIHSISP